MSKLAMAYAMKKRIKGVNKPKPEAFSKYDEGVSEAGDYHGNPRKQKEIHEDTLEELRSMKKPDIQGLAHGGDVSSDLVDRVMKKRMMAKGGMVEEEPFEYEFDQPDDFDVLHENSAPEFSYTGENSGDELGNEQEDHDRADIVARILKSRSKKDRNPRPA